MSIVRDFIVSRESENLASQLESLDEGLPVLDPQSLAIDESAQKVLINEIASEPCSCTALAPLDDDLTALKEGFAALIDEPVIECHCVDELAAPAIVEVAEATEESCACHEEESILDDFTWVPNGVESTTQAPTEIVHEAECPLAEIVEEACECQTEEIIESIET